MAALLSLRRLLAPLFAILACGSGAAQGAQTATLAIKGYDTVAYFTQMDAVPGQPQYEYEWDEQRYRFASAAHMRMFQADPGRYAPRFGNLCTSALAYGFPFEADPTQWTIYEGRLYVFGTAASLSVFKEDPKGMISAAGRNAERRNKGQPLAAELALTPEMKSGVIKHLAQCDRGPDAGPQCTPEIRAHARYILEHQPVSGPPGPRRPPAPP